MQIKRQDSGQGESQMTFKRMTVLCMLVCALSIPGVARASLYAHYTFDETSGPGVSDSSGNDRDLSETSSGNALTYGQTGQFDSALFFNGTDGNPGGKFLLMTPDAGMPGDGDEITIVFWANSANNWSTDNAIICDYNANGMRFSVGLNSSNYGLTIGVANGSASGGTSPPPNSGKAYVKLDGTGTSGVNLSANTWHHFAIAFSNNAISAIYIDGNAVVEDGDSYWYFNDVNNFTIGGRIVGTSTPFVFKGLLDDFAIYNEVLSKSAIENIMANGVIPEPASLALIAVGAGLLLSKRSRR